MDKADIDRMEKEDANRQLIDRNAGFQVAARIAGSTVPIVALLDASVGFPVALASMAAASIGLFLTEAKAGLEREKRCLDMKKAGYELPLQIASKGAGKPHAVRKLWLELLKNALDDKFNHSIRQSDVELLESLDAPDAILIMMRKHQSAMRDEWMATIGRQEYGFMLERCNRDTKECLGKACSFDLFYKYARIEIQGDITISSEEFRYSLKTKMLGKGGDKSLFYPTLYTSDGSIYFIENRTGIVNEDKGKLAEILYYELLPPAARLSMLVSVPSSKTES